MKRILTLTLALLMVMALFGVSGATRYAYAEGETPAPTAEPEAPQKKESTFTEQDIRREYTNRPANKLDIPAFLRK